jgi:dinuclear metal center YbgI/SA1388 family protein
MIDRDELIRIIEDELLGAKILDIAAKLDPMANGIQFHGQTEVNKIALGVSLNAEFLQTAIESGAQVCVFHHGFDPRTSGSCFTLPSQNRLKLICNHNLTIAGYHYALDAHPTLGNNAVIIEKLGAHRAEPLFDTWGWVGEFAEPHPIKDLAKQCTELFQHDVFAVYSEPKMIKRFGVVSGGGKPGASQMIEFQRLGIDLFISGETSESIPHLMQETGINYFACGHYNTEVFGVQALGTALRDRVGNRAEIEFIDVPNQI